MPGSLQHSPAEVIRQLIVDQDWGVDYEDDDTDWASFVSAEADLPDNAITVYDTTGRDDGREMVAGERAEEQGFLVRIRSKTHLAGYAKAQEIAIGFDAVDHVNVGVDEATYVVWAVMRTSSVLPIGYDAPKSKRSLFTINGVVSLRFSHVSGTIFLEDGEPMLQENGEELLLQ